MSDITKWADPFMFPAERSNAKEGPVAYLLQGTPDPLGSIAVAAEAYKGNFFEDKSAITDEQRRYYLAEMMKTKLKMPLESVQLHWRLKGVTRSFTHQMVRQRTAAYSQESMRFAVKEDASDAVALPPSLQKFNRLASEFFPVPPQQGHWTLGDAAWEDAQKAGMQFMDFNEFTETEAFGRMLKDYQMYIVWRQTCEDIGRRYVWLVNNGMPAEDARGLLAHNSVTQLNYITNLRNYLDHAGNRLCTQAQFEWRMVWVKMLQAMREYCTGRCVMTSGGVHTGEAAGDPACDNWQWKAISQIFLPVCYQTGSCQFQAEFDRKCSIRSRVQANADIGRSADQWAEPYNPEGATYQDDENARTVISRSNNIPVFIGAIHPAEWLADAAAAR